MNYTLLALAGYVALFVGYSFFSSRTETREDFLIAGRNQGFWPLVMSMNSSWINMGWMTFCLSLLLVDAASYAWLFIGEVVGISILIYLVPKIRAYAKEKDIVSFADFTHKSIGSFSGYSAASVNLILYIGWLTVELVASAHVLSSMFGLSYEMSLIALALTVCAYLALGGFKVLIKTDVIQFVFVILLAVLFYMYVPIQPVSMETVEKVFTTETPVNWVIFFAGLPAILLGSEVWQRIFSAKSDKTAKRMLAWTFPIHFLIYLPFLLLPFLVAPLFLPEQTEAIFSGVIKGYLPTYVAPFALIFLLAMITSTLDTAGFVAAQSLTNDGITRKYLEGHPRPRLLLRVGIFTVFAVAVGFGLFYQNVVDIMFFILDMWAVLSPLVVTILFGKKISDCACGSTIVFLTVFMLTCKVFGLLPEALTATAFLSGFVLPYIVDAIRNKVCSIKTAA